MTGAHQRGGQHTTGLSAGLRHCPNRRLKLTLPIQKKKPAATSLVLVQQGLSAAKRVPCLLLMSFLGG